MSAEEILITLIGVFILGIVVVGANYADHRQSSRARRAVMALLILVNILLVLNGLSYILSAYVTDFSSDAEPPGKLNAWGALAVSLLVAGLATLLLFPPAAKRIAVFFPRFRGKEKRQTENRQSDDWLVNSPAPSEASESSSGPLFPQMLNYYTADSILLPQPSTMAGWPGQLVDKKIDDQQVRGFNPASMVHLVAISFCLYFLGVQFISFILGGGLEGVAESYQEEGLSGWDLLLNSLPFVILPFLGVGLGVRRNLSQTLRRLGLGIPSIQGIAVSFGVTVGLFIMVTIIAVAWMALVPEDVYEEQTQASDALSKTITTVWLAFLLAATAAVGEEIAFRGALQPILGFWATAIIFAMTHIQYALTPAWLIIFVVALAFGWIRLRYNTTVAILTHFLYNFIPLALTLSAPEETESWILHALLWIKA